MCPKDQNITFLAASDEIHLKTGTFMSTDWRLSQSLHRSFSHIRRFARQIIDLKAYRMFVKGFSKLGLIVFDKAHPQGVMSRNQLVENGLQPPGTQSRTDPERQL